MMKYLLVVLLVLGAIVYGGLKWHAKVQHEKALAYQRQQELLAQEKAEVERKEQEAKAASAKEKAVQLLRAFLGRQEQLLKDTVEESKIQAELISEDQKRLSEELVALEKENLRKAEEARKRNRKRHDRAEDVLTMLKSPVLNKLAATYLGEDFSAMRADYQSKVSAIVNMQKETRRRLDANRAKYEKAVEGIDEEVDNKNTVARKKISSANEALERRLRNLHQEKKNLEAKLKKLNGPMQIKGPHLRREIEKVEKSLEQVTEEIGKVEEIVALSRSNVAHSEATTAETSARRRYDSAITTRQEDDNAVHEDMAHERSVFAMAVEYENRSLDMIRNAMRSRQDMLSLRVADAKKKLEYINQSTSNIDFLSADEVEDLRKKMSARLAEKIAEVAE